MMCEHEFEIKPFVGKHCRKCGVNKEDWLEQQLAAAIASAPTDIAYLLTEVERLNQMVERALPLLSEDGREVICPAMRNYWDNDCDFGCRVREKYLDCWRKYLEEAAGNG